jgi:DNA-binding transcriptional MocR family regulator
LIDSSGYNEACGSLALRSVIAAIYQQARPEPILITTGAIKAIFLLFTALLDEGFGCSKSPAGSLTGSETLPRR